jgi:acyl-CoA synthetase (AMP-forming)/AMP-acid ligase II
MPLQSEFPEVFIKDVPIHEYILDKILQYGRSIAMIDSDTGKKYTYEEIYIKSHQVAHGLYKNGFKQGDIVTICMPNSPEWSFIMFGVLLRGGVISSVNSVYNEEELQRHFKDSTSKYLFTRPQYLDKVQNAASKLGNQISKIFVVDVDKKQSLSGTAVPFDGLLDYSHDAELPKIKIWSKTDLGFLPFSSGTTGWPKGVMLSHYNVVGMLHILGTRAFFLVPSKGDHLIAMLPFFHIFGLMTLLMGLYEGTTLVTMSKFESEKYLQLIERYKVPILFVVPPILVILAKDEIVNKYDLSSVYGCCVGAAPVGKELSLEVIEKHPYIRYLIQGYGMTEMSCASHIMPVTPVAQLKHGSCGMLLPNFECKVVDLETKKELGPNQKGEICVKSVTCMLGYYNNPKATSETFDEEGWLHSGDIGYYDEDGHFFVIDRLKELIKVKGFQVPPAELEDLLLSHPEISDVAIIGVPELSSGEVPRAYVVLEAGSKLTEQQVVDFVDSKVAPYKKLKGGVEFVREIPKSPAGKILRRTIREEFARKRSKNNAKL